MSEEQCPTQRSLFCDFLSVQMLERFRTFKVAHNFGERQKVVLSIISQFLVSAIDCSQVKSELKNSKAGMTVSPLVLGTAE